MLTVQEIEALCAVAGVELRMHGADGWYSAGIYKGGRFQTGSYKGATFSTEEKAANAAWNNYIKENT